MTEWMRYRAWSGEILSTLMETLSIQAFIRDLFGAPSLLTSKDEIFIKPHRSESTLGGRRSRRISKVWQVLTGEIQEGLEALWGLGTNNDVLISLDSAPVSQAGFSLLGSRGMSPQMRRPELTQMMAFSPLQTLVNCVVATSVFNKGGSAASVTGLSNC